MDYQSMDFARERDKFAAEMNSGLAGEESSLKMLPTYIKTDGETVRNQSVIALDAGGTNFRVSVVNFDETGRPDISYYKKYSMPGTSGQVTKDEFFDALAGYLLPVIDLSDKIGFCFSYPTEMTDKRDGQLLAMSKELRVDGIIGEMIGENLIEALGRSGCKKRKSLTLLNDTVACLLGGAAVFPEKDFDGYIGFILGTGTNTCYIEDCDKITKLRGFAGLGGKMAINVESGGYSGIPRGALDVEFDKTTVSFGTQRLEKMVSGAYLGKLINTIICRAISDGILSESEAPDGLNTEQVHSFMQEPYGDNILSKAFQSENDKTALWFIINSIVQRAAKIAAIKIAAIIQKTGAGKNPIKPVCVSAEGALFRRSELFRKKLDYYTAKYLNEEMGVFVEFVTSDELVTIGTAIAAL